MRAVVLVGGFGTRLRPLTNTTPKPMLPVVNRPMLEHLVGGLARAGIVEVTLALGFKPEPFAQAFPDGVCAGVRLAYAVEPEPLDTAGAIRFAADHAGIDDTFVVANGDIMTDLDISKLLAAHRASGAEATIHVSPVDDPSAFGVVELDDDLRVLRFVEKPAPDEAPSNLINAGTYVLEPTVLPRIATGRKVSIEREVFPAIVADGGLFAYPDDAYWLDTGRPEFYLQANLDALAGRRRPHQQRRRARSRGRDRRRGVDLAVGRRRPMRDRCWRARGGLGGAPWRLHRTGCTRCAGRSSPAWSVVAPRSTTWSSGPTVRFPPMRCCPTPGCRRLADR